jgi:hypothetical protein
VKPAVGAYIKNSDIKRRKNMANSKIKKLRRKQRRKRKLRYLRRRLKMSKDLAERERLIEKIRRISPQAPVADYLAESS